MKKEQPQTNKPAPSPNPRITRISINQQPKLFMSNIQAPSNDRFTRPSNLTSYLNSKINREPQRTVYSQRNVDPNQQTIRTDNNLAYNTNSYISSYNNLIKSPQYNKSYYSGSNYNMPKTTTKVYKKSYQNVPEANKGNQFRKSSNGDTIIIEKTIEKEKPVYIEKETEIIKPGERVETVIEKPIYIKENDPSLEAEIRELRSKVYMLENENNLLKNTTVEPKIVEIKKEKVVTITDEHEKKSLEIKIADLSRELENTKELNKKIDTKNIKLEYDNQRLSEENQKAKELMDENLDLKNEVHSLKQQLITMNNLNSDKAKWGNERMIEENKRIKNDLDSLKEKLKEQCDRNDKDRKLLELEVAKYKDLLNEGKGKIDTSARNEQTLNNKITQYEDVFKRLQSDLESEKEKNRVLSAKVNEAQQAIEDAKNSVQMKLDNQQLTLSQIYKQQNEALKEEMDKQMNVLIEERNKNSKIGDQLASIQNENSDLKNIINQLEDKNKELEIQIEERQIEEEDIDGDNERKQTNGSMDPEHLVNLRDNNKEIKEEYENMLKDNITMLEQQLDEVNAKLLKKKSKGKSMKTQLNLNTFRLIATLSELERLRNSTLQV